MRRLRNHNHLQTNPFAVNEQLRGLVETFSVVGRDGLAEALRTRLRALAAHATRWTPETLHLLLELSDQPVEKSSLASLQRLRPPHAEQTPRLTWDDIAAEDGWARDGGLWANVDFADSSDDGLDPLPDSQSQASDADTSTSSAMASGQRAAEDLALLTPEWDRPLGKIQQAQDWHRGVQPRDASGRHMKIPLSEHQVLREVLFLLNGLPTNLFGPDCTPIPLYQLANVTWDTYRALINSFAEYGRTLLPLRKFRETRQDIPLVQAFQSSVLQALRAFDWQIALLQGRYVDIKADTIVSLLALQEELRSHLRPMAALSDVVRRLQEERYAHSFRFLELLYDAVCAAQSSGDQRIYSYLGHIFFNCFRVYTRPIRQWMEEGELSFGDKTFFVAESSISVPLHRIWSDKYRLRRSQEGQLHAPGFLQPAVRKIFNTGKSIVVLKHLGRFRQSAELNQAPSPEAPLDFASVCGSPDFAFAPFSELFGSAFDRWVQSKHLSTSSNLQVILFESCGLWSNLSALEHIYFMSDGSLADVFTSAVFASLDVTNTTRMDRFTLTELAQEAWSPCTSFESYRLAADMEPEPELKHDSHGRSSPTQASIRGSMGRVRLSYKLAWPVQLIITRDTFSHYQSIFTFLLQLRRAAAILNTFKAHRADAEQHGAYYSLRARLLWFTTTLRSYLTTLVLAPETVRMRARLHKAEDLDSMIDLHSAFMRRVVEEACLGKKLAPIRECVLDMLDLAIRLDDARRTEQERVANEPARFARLGTPPQVTLKTGAMPPQSVARGVYISPKEKEREEDQTIVVQDVYQDTGKGQRNTNGDQAREVQTYAETLVAIRAGFDRHLRFIAGALRGVARASTDPAAVKWDILAEMLEVGIREGDH